MEQISGEAVAKKLSFTLGMLCWMNTVKFDVSSAMVWLGLWSTHLSIYHYISILEFVILCILFHKARTCWNWPSLLADKSRCPLKRTSRSPQFICKTPEILLDNACVKNAWKDKQCKWRQYSLMDVTCCAGSILTTHPAYSNPLCCLQFIAAAIPGT